MTRRRAGTAVLVFLVAAALDHTVEERGLTHWPGISLAGESHFDVLPLRPKTFIQPAVTVSREEDDMIPVQHSVAAEHGRRIDPNERRFRRKARRGYSEVAQPVPHGVSDLRPDIV